MLPTPRHGRRPGAVALTCAALCLLSFGAAVCPAASIARGGGFREIVVTPEEAEAGVVLPDVFILVGSDSVFVDGSSLARGIGYEFDHDSGRVVVLAQLTPQSDVRIAYRYVPLNLKRVYTGAVTAPLAALPPGFSREAVIVRSPGDSAAAAPPHGLTIGGAKTFGITMGSNRDASLEQSLRLNISGNVTRDVSVKAYLSDQNTPLVPEGDTEELRALDKVLVEIEGPGVAATMGDYELRIDGGPLADFRREESGAKVSAELGPAEMVVAGARSAGQFMSLTFRGVDGKQGAYLLTDASGATGVSVVAGSERVWLDGRRLTRGSDNDYVIDYPGGAIEFTERVPIVAENEITVDYEFASDDYRRDSYAGRAVLASDGGSRLGLSFFKEVDDRDASASAAFSEKELAVLAAAGDDADLAHDDGVDSVGIGNGDYLMLGPGVFEYAGADSGDYDLHFERSEGGGYDYEFLDGYYTYVGEGQGDYRLGRQLPMPTDHGLLAVDGRLELGGEGRVEATAAVSDFDANTYSEVDDGNNLGNAQVVSAALPVLDPGEPGGARFAFSLLGRRVGGAFRGVSRFRELGYKEKWELEGLALPAGENMVEGAATLKLAGGGRAEASYAWLERGDAVESTKAEFSLEGRPTELSRAWASGRFVDSDFGAGAAVDGSVGSNGGAGDGASGRERRLYRGGFEHSVGPVRPGVRFAHDERLQGEEGERYDEYGASLENSRSGDLTFGASYAHRLTDRTDGGGWDRASVTRTQEYRLGFTRWEQLRLRGSVVRREVEFEEGFEDPTKRYDLADVRLSHESLGGGLAGEVRYSVTATEVEEKQKYTVVEEGVEITRIVRTGEYLPVTDLTASTKWTFKPGFRGRGGRGRDMPAPTAFGRFLSALSLTSDVKLRESTTTDDKRGLYLLDPDVIRGPDTVRGELYGRHVVRYLSASSSLSVRLALTTRDVLDRSYTNAPSTRTERAGTADVKLTRTGGVTYRLQGDVGTREQDADGDDDYDIEERAILGEAGFRRFGDLEAKLTASYGWQNETLSDVVATVLKVTPGLTYRLAGKGALSCSVTRIEVTAEGGSLPERPYLAEGRREGLSAEWRVTGDYRFNRYITGSLSYTGETRPDSDTVHTLDFRVNAYF